jgi:threonyl-tRNA synthetase
MLTIGDQECENKTVSLRSRENIVFGEMSLDKFLEIAEKEYKEKSLKPHFTA